MVEASFLISSRWRNLRRSYLFKKITDYKFHHYLLKTKKFRNQITWEIKQIGKILIKSIIKESVAEKTYLCVKHDCNNIVFGLGIVFFNQVNNFLVGWMVSMRHIQPSNIHSLLSQLPYPFPGVRGRTNCANNLGLPYNCRLRQLTRWSFTRLHNST